MSAADRPVLPLADMRWQDIPVFIVNRNRHAALRRLVEWLKDCGSEQVVILDNQSTYAPLLAWYDRLPPGVQVQRFDRNLGPYAFWKHGLHRTLGLPYVFTDSDLVPADFCPPDLIDRLRETLCRHPDAGKAGPSLRIDNLPACYPQAEMVYRWESQFWEQPVAHRLYAAPLDTTFALYPAGVDFTRDERNLRLGHPYTLEHTPWYVDEAALSQEELHYRAHTSREFSHWSGANPLTDRLARSERLTGFDQRPAVLHLGGGDEHIPGWINADSCGRLLDVAFDVEQCGGQRLPIDDGALDGIYMSHALQRVLDLPALLRELYRVARPGALWALRLPHGAANAAWADPRNLRPWFEDSFDAFAAPLQPAGCGWDWQLEQRTLVVAPEVLALGQAGAEAAVRSQRNLVQEMWVTLRAVKPGRDGRAPVERPAIRFCTPQRLPVRFTRAAGLPGAALPAAAAATPAPAARATLAC